MTDDEKAAIERRVVKVIADLWVGETKPVTPDAMLVTDLGADSLDLVELHMELDDEFSIELDDEAIQNHHRVCDVVAAVVAEIELRP